MCHLQIKNRAFLWTAESGMVDLNTLIPADSNWTLLEAADINNLGQIVGVGTNPLGQKRAFLLTPSPDLAIPGDYNGNGVVDAADYTVWRDTLGQSGAGLAADGTGPAGIPDGVVDQLDYDFWKAHFGESSNTGALSASVEAIEVVPEPSTFCLLLTILALLIKSKRSCTPDNDVRPDE